MLWNPPTLWYVGGPDGVAVLKKFRMSFELPFGASRATCSSCACGPVFVTAHVLVPAGNVSGESYAKSRIAIVTGAFGFTLAAGAVPAVTCSCFNMPLAKC